MYKISILLPVFNVEEYLEDCLSSLINQTIGFENLEIIFVDDCSTDNSYNIIKDFSKKYENIKAFQNSTNSGVGGQPRNIAMEHATAPYIMFLDPDDTYYENACEILYASMISTDADMASGNYVEYKNGEAIKPMDYKGMWGLKGNYLEIDNIDEFPQLLELSPAVWVKIFKRKFLIENNLKFLEYVVAEDLYFVSQCLIKSKKIVYVDVPIVKYVIRESKDKSKSVTSMRNVRNLLGYIHVYNRVYKDISEYNRELAWRSTIHLYFGTIQFVLSQTLKKDKIDFLYNSKDLYKVFLNNYKPLLGYEEISRYISEENFLAAINVAEIMEKDLTNDEDLFKKLINKDVIVLYDAFDDSRENRNDIYDLVNSLSNENFNISVININSDEEMGLIDNEILFEKEEYSKKYGLIDSIKFINLFEYFINSSSSDFDKIGDFSYDVPLKNEDFYFTEKLYLTKNFVIIKEYSIGKLRKINYYKIDDFTQEELDLLSQLKYDDEKIIKILSSKNKIKSKKINDNQLVVNSIFNMDFNEEYMYSSDNKELLSFHKNKKSGNSKLSLFKQNDDFNLIFKSKKEFIHYFLLYYCMGFEEKPFIIDLTSDEDIQQLMSSCSYLINDFNNYNNDNWLNILKNSYINSKIREIKLSNDFMKYKKLNDEYLELSDNNLLQEYNEKIDENQKELNELNQVIQEQNVRIHQQKNDIQEKKNYLNQLKSESSSINSLNQNIILNLKTTIDYNKLKTNSKKRLLLFLPYLYILYRHKTIIVNVKLYRKLVNNDWFDIGYYLNTNSDLSRKKWCKMLTPEVHYVCHGFDEKRLPNPDYKNKYSKKELISKINNDVIL